VIDPVELATDISGDVALLALPAVLWGFLYLLAWEHGPFAASIGFGRRTFWLLLPGALLATLVLLPVAPVSNDWVAVSFAGALFPLFVAVLSFARFAPPGRRSAPMFLALLVAESVGLLIVVVKVASVEPQLVGVVALAALFPIVAGIASLGKDRPALGPVALVLGLTSGVLVLTFLSSTAIPGVGIEESFPAYLIPPVAAGFIAAFVAEWVFPGAEGFALPVAYVAGTFGVLIGADVLRQPPLYDGGPAGLYAIGGAGVLDLVYLSGLLAFGAAYLGHRLLGRGFPPVGAPQPPAEPTPIGRLARAFRSGVEGRIDETLHEASTASVEAALQAGRLLGQPAPPPGRPWEGLPVPGWVVSDQANLEAVDRAGSTDGREGFRAFLTARWLVLLGRELGLRRFATVGARSLAFLVDLLIVTAPAAALWALLLLTTPGTLVDLAGNVGFNAAIYGYAAAAFLYFALAEAFAGRTLGKALLGLEVRDRRLERPRFTAALVRNASKLPTLTVVGVGVAIAILLLVKSGTGATLNLAGGLPISVGLLDFLEVLGFVVGVVGLLGTFAVLLIALSSERQRFGDLVAGTWVVRATPPAAPVPLASPTGAAGGGRSG
jgi:uncharacterized membrane protein/uncharacterized RDD family membrane protein YckC